MYKPPSQPPQKKVQDKVVPDSEAMKEIPYIAVLVHEKDQ
jgi:hypothetical protein